MEMEEGKDNYKNTDTVARFNQVANQTQPDTAAWANGQWIKKFEDFTIRYLQFIFRKSDRQTNEGQQINDLLQETQTIASQLDDSRAAAALPYMANLTFIKRQDFGEWDTTMALQIVDRYREVVNTHEHRQLDLDTQFRKLIDFVDNVRKLVEFLMKSAGKEIPPEPYLGTSTATTRAGYGLAGAGSNRPPNSYGSSNNSRSNRYDPLRAWNSTNQSGGADPSKIPLSLSRYDPSTNPIGLTGFDPSRYLSALSKYVPSNMSTTAPGQALPNNSNNSAASSAYEPSNPAALARSDPSKTAIGSGTGAIPPAGQVPAEPVGIGTSTTGLPELLVSIVDDMYQSLLAKIIENRKNETESCTCRNRNKRHSGCKDPYRHHHHHNNNGKDNWAPMMIQGQGLTTLGLGGEVEINIPSITNFQSIRPLNLPGNQPFETRCTPQPTRPPPPYNQNYQMNPNTNQRGFPPQCSPRPVPSPCRPNVTRGQQGQGMPMDQEYNMQMCQQNPHQAYRRPQDQYPSIPPSQGWQGDTRNRK